MTNAAPSSERRRFVVPGTAEAVDALLPFIADAEARASGPLAGSGATVFTRPVVLLDGRSGSGKTALAAALTAAWTPGPPAPPPTVVHLDDIYPGWQGLEAASSHVFEHLLSDREPRWQRYDWAAERPAEWASVDPQRPLIVEGAGVLSRRNAERATLTIWLELDDETRYHRAIARDGATYEPYWQTWAAQELAFSARENPAGLADVTIDFTAR